MKADVGYVEPGDRVIMSFKPFCGKCYYCIRGEAHLCNDPGLAARGAQHLRWKGQPILQMASVGSFSEYMIAPGRRPDARRRRCRSPRRRTRRPRPRSARARLSRYRPGAR